MYIVWLLIALSSVIVYFYFGHKVDKNMQSNFLAEQLKLKEQRLPGKRIYYVLLFPTLVFVGYSSCIFAISSYSNGPINFFCWLAPGLSLAFLLGKRGNRLVDKYALYDELPHEKNDELE